MAGLTGLCGLMTVFLWLAGLCGWLADFFMSILCGWLATLTGWLVCVAGWLVCVTGWLVYMYGWLSHSWQTSLCGWLACFWRLAIFGDCCVPGCAVSSALFVMDNVMTVMIVIFKSSYCHPWRGLPSWCCGLGMMFELGRLPNSLRKNWTREGVTLYGRIAVWDYTFENQKTKMSYNVGCLYLYIYRERERECWHDFIVTLVLALLLVYLCFTDVN